MFCILLVYRETKPKKFPFFSPSVFILSRITIQLKVWVWNFPEKIGNVLGVGKGASEKSLE